MGITGLWLLPIYPSPSYHGYNVDNYYDVNPDYGTMEDFEKLIAECNKRGIHVMLDITLNHSSINNPYFVASKNPEDSHREWYHWVSKDDPNVYLGAKIWGHNLWNEDAEHPCFYYAGEFEGGMPDYNLNNSALRAEFKNILKFWLDKGVSGFRFDAAGHIYDSIKYPKGEASVEKAVDFWKEMTDYIHSVKKDAYNVAEVWDSSLLRARYAFGTGSTFHFDMGTRILSTVASGSSPSNALAFGMQEDYAKLAEFAPNAIDSPFLTNHDQVRAASTLKGDVPSLKLAAALYIFAPGTPFIYYGEEIGMKSGSRDETKRTPFLWGASYKGETSWANENDCIYNKNTLSVSEQQKDSESLLSYYKTLIRAKTENPALLRGKFDSYSLQSDFVVSWKMESEEQSAIVVSNVGKEKIIVKATDIPDSAKVVFASSKESNFKSGEIALNPQETLVIAWLKS